MSFFFNLKLRVTEPTFNKEFAFEEDFKNKDILLCMIQIMME